MTDIIYDDKLIMMERSTLLMIAGIMIFLTSFLALIATPFMALVTQTEYFVFYHYGYRVIDTPFYLRISIIAFVLYASIFGIISAKNTFKGKNYGFSIFGAILLLIAGLLFFVDIPLYYLPIETYYFNGDHCWGFPTIVLASISLILLALRRQEFKDSKINPLFISGTLLILCSIISALLTIFSYIPYEQAAGAFSGKYSFVTMIVSIFTLLFTLMSGLLFIKKKHLHLSLVLTTLSLLSALSLSFFFMIIFPWIGSLVRGLVTEALIITVSTVTLILAFLEQRKRKHSTAQ